MEFSVVAALVAGLVATAVMTMMMKMAGGAGMTQMPPMELISGSMITGDETKAKQIGFVVHWIMMGTVVFGLVYALIFSIVGSALAARTRHRRSARHRGRRDDADHAGDASAHVRIHSSGRAGHRGRRRGSPFCRGSVRRRLGWHDPVGMIMGHAVSGLVLALVYHYHALA